MTKHYSRKAHMLYDDDELKAEKRSECKEGSIQRGGRVSDLNGMKTCIMDDYEQRQSKRNRMLMHCNMTQHCHVS